MNVNTKNIVCAGVVEGKTVNTYAVTDDASISLDSNASEELSYFNLTGIGTSKHLKIYLPPPIGSTDNTYGTTYLNAKANHEYTSGSYDYEKVLGLSFTLLFKGDGSNAATVTIYAGLDATSVSTFSLAATKNGSVSVSCIDDTVIGGYHVTNRFLQ